jgi:hypothetical protein
MGSSKRNRVPIFLIHGTLAHRQDSVSQRIARCFRKDTVDARRHLSTVQLPEYMSTGFNGIALAVFVLYCSRQAFVEGKT